VTTKPEFFTRGSPRQQLRSDPTADNNVYECRDLIEEKLLEGIRIRLLNAK